MTVYQYIPWVVSLVNDAVDKHLLRRWIKAILTITKFTLWNLSTCIPKSTYVDAEAKHMNSFNGAPENAQRKGTLVNATALMFRAFGFITIVIYQPPSDHCSQSNATRVWLPRILTMTMVLVMTWRFTVYVEVECSRPRDMRIYRRSSAALSLIWNLISSFDHDVICLRSCAFRKYSTTIWTAFLKVDLVNLAAIFCMNSWTIQFHQILYIQNHETSTKEALSKKYICF